MAKKKTTRKKTTTKKKTTRKPAARKTTAKKKTAKKTTRRTTTKKAVKKTPTIRGSAEPRTKSQIFNTIAEATDMSRKEVTSVLGALESLIVTDLKKGTAVKLMGMKMTVKKKPATKACKGINPFTGEEMMFKAKPASKQVKIRPLKTLKDMV